MANILVAEQFSSIAELVAFVNSEGISKGNIEDIVYWPATDSNDYKLFYWVSA